ncbi:MAG: Fe-S cluster assembly ATPase SufC [Candidatus Dadabacteria bacterium]|nr:Fe-S cluster assembly ATPase SufC [Candidatus Dadabacteria bacterium]
MLEIKDLYVKVEDKEIIKGLNLTVNPGEVHSIMGPNGSGKSTLSQVLAGKESYEVTSGSITFKGKDLLELAPEERACEGVFLAFQYPVEIAGVANTYLLREALNSKRKYQGLEPLKHVEFIKNIKEKMKNLKIDDTMLSRSVNEGFSGGEKKRNEIFQMQVLEPDLCILDETDSGLDIDALQIVADGVNAMRDEGRSFVVITHYQRLLNYIVPDFVHVLIDGKIERSGDKSLALELEDKGYTGIAQQPSAA